MHESPHTIHAEYYVSVPIALLYTSAFQWNWGNTLAAYMVEWCVEKVEEPAHSIRTQLVRSRSICEKAYFTQGAMWCEVEYNWRKIATPYAPVCDGDVWKTLAKQKFARPDDQCHALWSSRSASHIIEISKLKAGCLRSKIARSSL